MLEPKLYEACHGFQPFSFAGLWAYNSDLDITSRTILTAAAQEPMRQLHDRQPVIQQIG